MTDPLADTYLAYCRANAALRRAKPSEHQALDVALVAACADHELARFELAEWVE